MLIKELEDVLVLVEDMPREWQIKCVKLLFWQVENWEQRQSEPELTDDEWYKLQRKRSARQMDHLRNAIARLEDALSETDAFEELFQPVTCVGIVESYDPAKGYGEIVMENSECALLHVTCLRACGIQGAPRPGARVTFQAIRRKEGWQAYRILALAPPDDRRA